MDMVFELPACLSRDFAWNGVWLELGGMQVTHSPSQAPHPPSHPLAVDALGEGSEGGDGSLQVWEAVVQVQPAASGGLLDFHPVSVKRKHAYHSTLTLSPHALALLMGKGNASTLLGFESRDEGFARRAAEEQP